MSIAAPLHFPPVGQNISDLPFVNGSAAGRRVQEHLRQILTGPKENMSGQAQTLMLHLRTKTGPVLLEMSANVLDTEMGRVVMMTGREIDNGLAGLIACESVALDEGSGYHDGGRNANDGASESNISSLTMPPLSLSDSGGASESKFDHLALLDREKRGRPMPLRLGESGRGAQSSEGSAALDQGIGDHGSGRNANGGASESNIGMLPLSTVCSHRNLAFDNLALSQMSPERETREKPTPPRLGESGEEAQSSEGSAARAVNLIMAFGNECRSAVNVETSHCNESTSGVTDDSSCSVVSILSNSAASSGVQRRRDQRAVFTSHDDVLRRPTWIKEQAAARHAVRRGVKVAHASRCAVEKLRAVGLFMRIARERAALRVFFEENSNAPAWPIAVRHAVAQFSSMLS